MAPESLKGLAAEYMVCADLCRQGFPAYLSAQGMRYDVVVDVSGRMLRIQVKGTAEARTRSPDHRSATYKFRIQAWDARVKSGSRRPISAHEIDCVALVAIDIGAIAYVPPTFCMKRTVQLRPPGTQITAWKRAADIDQFPFTKLLQEITL